MTYMIYLAVLSVRCDQCGELIQGEDLFSRDESGDAWCYECRPIHSSEVHNARWRGYLESTAQSKANASESPEHRLDGCQDTQSPLA